MNGEKIFFDRSKNKATTLNVPLIDSSLESSIPDDFDEEFE